ncbi:MAG TPA: type I-C CRISPR-associated protein Cas8c/Csd1 [Pirellulales bacterium]|nr:type I-C CRISPR-associated protein Cas8c/Csd1 [Pirellulales bacterium]
MILNRLYELAIRESLLDDPSIETQPIPYVVKLTRNGDYLGVEERRGEIVIPSKKKSGPTKTKPDKGKPLAVPKAHGNPANKGFARYFADTLPRVLPINDDPKSAASRETFWNQIAGAAQATDDPALKAALAFGRHTLTDASLAAKIVAELQEYKVGPGDRCTLAWAPDEGATIVERSTVRDWYRVYFAELAAEKAEKADKGFCQITGEYGALARSHATKIVGVPDGMAAGVSVVSYDKGAFESYGFDGAVNAGISFRAADGYTRALNALLANAVPNCPSTCFKTGGVAFLFWTRNRVDEAFWMVLSEPTPQEVERLLKSHFHGQETHGVEANDFYCLCISGNAARAIVRDYLEEPLPTARESLARWFADLLVADQFSGEHKADFSIWALATATVRSGDDLPPALMPTLARCALTGTPVPENVLAACLRRLRVETGGAQFTPARMALIKLILNRLPHIGDQRMTEALDESTSDRSPGYACGRLLALLARCQSPRDYGTSAQLLERYYGSASTAPRSVLAVLLRLNRHHLRKIRDEMPGFAFNLEQELEARLAPFRATPTSDPNFPAVLSLAEQGRFALGFYQQRAAYRAAGAERRLAEEATT